MDFAVDKLDSLNENPPSRYGNEAYNINRALRETLDSEMVVMKARLRFGVKACA
jgi:hypothetical protein